MYFEGRAPRAGSLPLKMYDGAGYDSISRGAFAGRAKLEYR